jgi:hypothetical protein
MLLATAPAIDGQSVNQVFSQAGAVTGSQVALGRRDDGLLLLQSSSLGMRGQDTKMTSHMHAMISGSGNAVQGLSDQTVSDFQLDLVG